MYSVSHSRQEDRISMTLQAPTATWLSKRRFGCISLALSLAETLIVYGAVMLVQTSNQPQPSPLILRMAGNAWLVGGLGSLGFAVAGLVADSDRKMAFVAMLATIVTFLVCGLQMLV
jgi:hypothetical protein